MWLPHWLLSFGFASALAPPVLGQTSPALELEYEAPEGCPAREAVSRAVLDLASAGHPLSGRLVARVVVRGDENAGFVLAIETELDGVHGERELSGRTCRSVVDAAVVVLALVLNPELERLEAEDHSTRDALPHPVSPQPAPRPAPPPVFMKATPNPQKKRARVSLVGVVTGGIGAGVLSEPSPEAGAGVGVILPSAWMEIAGIYRSRQEERLGDHAAGGRLWAGGIEMRGCWLPGSTRFLVGPCLGAGVDGIYGRGFGVSEEKDGVIEWVSGSGGLHGELRLARSLLVMLSAEGWVPLARPELYLDELGTVRRPSRLGTRLRLGVAAGPHLTR